MIKLGGHVFPSAEQNAKDPELLAHLAKQMGYQAAYAPDYLTIDKPDEIRIARKAFEKGNSGNDRMTYTDIDRHIYG